LPSPRRQWRAARRAPVRQTAHGPAEELRQELVGLGRAARSLSPHVGRAWGGLGLDRRAQAAGAGADPSMLCTSARRDGADFVIDGTKWLITGAVGAELAIIMAKNDSDALGPHGATMFLAPMKAAGIHIERVLDTLDRFIAGGHAVVRLAGLRVPESAVLGRVGAGFRYAQVRLAPARLTHCKPIGEHEGVGLMLADNEMDIHQSRLVIWHAAWVLDQGERGAHESSMTKVMTKVICSKAIWRVVDRSMQILGGLGITDDTIVARLFREVRPFRIYDGPSEVHRWSIARRVLRASGAAS
jgi:acyl-CoA dehydrogenase